MPHSVIGFLERNLNLLSFSFSSFTGAVLGLLRMDHTIVHLWFACLVNPMEFEANSQYPNPTILKEFTSSFEPLRIAWQNCELVFVKSNLQIVKWIKVNQDSQTDESYRCDFSFSFSILVHIFHVWKNVSLCSLIKIVKTHRSKVRRYWELVYKELLWYTFWVDCRRSSHKQVRWMTHWSTRSRQWAKWPSTTTEWPVITNLQFAWKVNTAQFLTQLFYGTFQTATHKCYFHHYGKSAKTILLCLQKEQVCYIVSIDELDFSKGKYSIQ